MNGLATRKMLDKYLSVKEVPTDTVDDILIAFLILVVMVSAIYAAAVMALILLSR